MYLFILIACGLFTCTPGFIPPMKKPDGSVDLTSIVSHITFLEHNVANFHTKTTEMESEIQTTKKELEGTKTELQATRTELQDHKKQSAAEITSLQDELFAIKGELGLTSNELISVKSEVKALKTEFLSLKAQINNTIIDTIGHDVISNMADLKRLQTNFQAVQHNLDQTNSSIEALITNVRDVNETSSAATRAINQEQTEMRTEMTNLGSLLNQLQSTVNSTTGSVNHVKDNVMAVQSQLSTTTNDISLIKSDMSSLRRNMSQSQIKDKDNFIAVQSQLITIKSDITLVRSDMTGLRQNISVVDKKSHGNSQSLVHLSQKLALKTQDVSFNAYMSDSVQSGINQPLQFDGVRHNTGSYDITTGKFTAPVSGTYIFSVQVEIHEPNTPKATRLYIVQSGTWLDSVYGRTTKDNDDVMIPLTVVTHARQGEQVWVASAFDVKFYGGSFASHFVGALLAAD